MRKAISSIIVLLLIVISTVSIAAESTLNITFNNDKIEAGKEIKVIISVNNFTRTGDQKAIEFKLGYDASKVEYKAISWKNGWSGTVSSDRTGIVASKSGIVAESENIAEITFNVKENTEIGKITFTATNILTSSDGDEEELASSNGIIEVIAAPKPSEPTPEPGQPQEQEPSQKQEQPEDSKINNPTNNPTNEENEKTSTNKDSNININSKDNTLSNKNLPKTGTSNALEIMSVVILLVGIILYIKINRYEKNY